MIHCVAIGLLVGRCYMGTNSSDYALGSGSSKTPGLALYSAKQYNDGRYLDVIGKIKSFEK